jgi:hypothetical protein
VSAQEKRPLAADYPLIDKKCSMTAEAWGTSQTWKASCRLYVYRKKDAGYTEGVVLFDLPLVLAMPATFGEASKAVEKWLSRQSVELLRRNGYPVDGKKK